MSFFLRSQGMGVAAIALATSVFLSRFLGLVRDKIISYYFGAGIETDIYFTAFVIPDYLNYLLAGGYFSITLVPLLAAAFARDDEDGWRFFSAAVCWASALIIVLTVLAWIFAPQLAKVAAPGFLSDPDAVARLTRFLRIILPAQAFFLPGACFTALLYYRRQFAVPALTPLVYNGTIILLGLAGLYLFPASGMEGFCWGVLAGAALGSFMLPYWAARKGGLAFLPGFSHPALKTLLLMALPLMLGQSIVALDEQFVRIFGSLTGQGGVSLLNYSRRIMLVPVGVVAQAAGVASYPFLAALAASGEEGKFNQTLNKALINSLLVALPLSIWMITAAEPIMRLIYQQGGFTAEEATRSGILLGIMLSSVAFWAVQQVMGRAFYARQDTLTPAIVGTIVTLAVLPLYWLGAKKFGAVGVAVAGTVGVVAYAIVLCVVWMRRFSAEAVRGLFKYSMLGVLFCAPSAAVAYGSATLIGRLWAWNSLMGAFARIAVSGTAFVAVYLLLAVFFCKPLAGPVLDLWLSVQRRLRKGRG